jgi:hypothetical protein
MSVIGLVPYYSTYTHQDWDGYSKFISDKTNPGDTVIVLPNYNRNVFDFYYNSTIDETNELGIYNSLTDVIASSNGVTYYVLTSDIYAVDPNGEIYTWLESNTVKVSDYTGIVTYVKYG